MFPACANSQCDQRNPACKSLWFSGQKTTESPCSHLSLRIQKQASPDSQGPLLLTSTRVNGSSPSLLACWRGPRSERFEKGRWPCYSACPCHKTFLLYTLFKREILVWGHMSDIAGYRARVSCPSGSPFLPADSNSSLKMSSSKKHSAIGPTVNI